MKTCPSFRNFGVLAVFGIILWLITQVNGDARTYVGTLDSTRPFAQIATFILGCVSIWAIWSTVHHYRRYKFSFAWSASFRMVGWLPIALSSLAVVSLIVLNLSSEDMPWFRDNRAIESIIPLTIGIVSSMIFSPTDDTTVEIQLTLARPISWVVLERLAIVMIPQFIIGIVAVGITLIKVAEADLVITLLRWIPPSTLLASIGIFVTFKGQNMALGVVVVGFMWVIFLIFESFFIPNVPIFFPLNHLHPYIWVFNPYLQPETLPMDAYWLNRLCVTFSGISLLALTVYQLRDEEYVLLGTKSV